jgi:hypothetical protein
MSYDELAAVKKISSSHFPATFGAYPSRSGNRRFDPVTVTLNVPCPTLKPAFT